MKRFQIIDFLALFLTLSLLFNASFGVAQEVKDNLGKKIKEVISFIAEVFKLSEKLLNPLNKETLEKRVGDLLEGTKVPGASRLAGEIEVIYPRGIVIQFPDDNIIIACIKDNCVLNEVYVNGKRLKIENREIVVLEPNYLLDEDNKLKIVYTVGDVRKIRKKIESEFDVIRYDDIKELEEVYLLTTKFTDICDKNLTRFISLLIISDEFKDEVSFLYDLEKYKFLSRKSCNIN